MTYAVGLKMNNTIVLWRWLSVLLMEEDAASQLTRLHHTGILAKHMPELDCLWGIEQSATHHPEVDTGVHSMMVLDQAIKEQSSLNVRFACLVHDLGKGTTPKDELPRHIGHEQRSADIITANAQKWGLPAEVEKLSVLVAKEHLNIHKALELNASALFRLFRRCDAFQNPGTFYQAIKSCQHDARGRLGFENCEYPQIHHLVHTLSLCLQLDLNDELDRLKRAGHNEQRLKVFVQTRYVQELNQYLNNRFSK